MGKDIPEIKDLFRIRLKEAWRIRRGLLGYKYFRWVYSEADYLPGLIIDYYGELAVIQYSSLFYEENLDHLIDAMLDFGVSHVYYVQSSQAIKEGILREEGYVYGETEEGFVIEENGVKYYIDPRFSLKTGHFFDQRENRVKIRRYSEDSIVLDAFCYSGGFGINALMSGAKKVFFLDKSDSSLYLLRKNLRLNDLHDHDYEIIKSDAFEFFKKNDVTFDLIILDPPGWVKWGNAKRAGMKSLFVINKLASKFTREILFSFSCDQPVERWEFLQLVEKATGFRLIEVLGQSPDHTPHPMHPELEYLKGGIFTTRTF